MTRPEAFAMARQRVHETSKPWLVVNTGTNKRPRYDTASSYLELPKSHVKCAWLSVDGSVRVYDGLGVPEGTEGSER